MIDTNSLPPGTLAQGAQWGTINHKSAAKLRLSFNSQ